MADGPVNRPAGSIPEDSAEVSLGDAITEVSDRATLLVQEEIALAKAEISEKVNSILAGSAAGILAGFFALLALIMVFEGLAWQLADITGWIWLGFLITIVLLLALAAGTGLFAYRSIKKGAPPTPDMAIEEAKKTRDQFAPPHGDTLPATPAPPASTGTQEGS